MALMENFHKIDRVVLVLVLVLIGFGLLSLSSAAYQKKLDTGKNFVITQLFWLMIGGMFFLLILSTSYQSFLNVAYIIYFINILFLILVLVAGKTALGAQRWISIGGMNFQPSEFSKIFTLLALARFVSDNPQNLRKISGLILPFLIVLVPMFLIFKQPDLGTSLVFLPILFSVLLVGGIKIRYLVTVISGFVFSLPFLWSFLKEYQRDRLLVFLNPDLDPLGAGYTINQSKIAIGSGTFFGKGWLAGTQNQLNFLPERHTDFIFSVIGEEWGFAGACVVLTVFLFLVLRGLKIADTTNESGGKLIAVGVTTMLAIHVIINIGMTLGLMPVVGMPLPFVSYGGSALLSNIFAVSFLLNVRMYRTRF